jgi:hypothetical protein
LSILVPSAVRCVAGSLSPVAGLQGARIPIIIANPRSFGLSRFYFASLPALPDRPSQAICEITNPAWHKNRIERWLSIGILDGARGGFGVRFPPDKIGAREIHVIMDMFLSPFSNQTSPEATNGRRSEHMTSNRQTTTLRIRVASERSSAVGGISTRVGTTRMPRAGATSTYC